MRRLIWIDGKYLGIFQIPKKIVHLDDGRLSGGSGKFDKFRLLFQHGLSIMCSKSYITPSYVIIKIFYGFNFFLQEEQEVHHTDMSMYALIPWNAYILHLSHFPLGRVPLKGKYHGR